MRTIPKCVSDMEGKYLIQRRRRRAAARVWRRGSCSVETDGRYLGNYPPVNLTLPGKQLNAK